MSQLVVSGHIIKRMRNAAGLTQKELAKRANVSQALISRIESGTIDPRVSTVTRIVQAIDASMSNVTTAAEIMNTPVLTVEANQPVRAAVELMKGHDISQLPVIKKGHVVGSIQESSIIKRLTVVKDADKFFKQRVQEVMEHAFPSVPPNTPLQELVFMLSRGTPAVLVSDRGKLVGVITKIDGILALLRSTNHQALQRTLMY